MNKWFIKFILTLHVTLKNSSAIFRGRNCSLSHFIDVETEVQIGTASCPKSYRKLVAEPGVKTWAFHDNAGGLSIFLTWSHLFSFVLAFMWSTSYAMEWKWYSETERVKTKLFLSRNHQIPKWNEGHWIPWYRDQCTRKEVNDGYEINGI